MPIFFDLVVITEGEPFLPKLLNGMTPALTCHHIPADPAAQRILASIQGDWEIMEAVQDELDDDRTHYQQTLIALAETQKEMEQIDETIIAHGGRPGAFAH